MSHASLNQSLSQQQTLAPQMRKSLEILQASTLELTQLVRQSLETNPVLEDITEIDSLDAEGPDPEEADSLDYLNETDDDWRDRSIMEGRTSPWTSEDEERRQRLYDSIVAPETLQQHLSHQLDLSMVEPSVREAGRALIANLDERGFLDMPAKELAVRMNLKNSDLREALVLIQSFDPPGVGAESIQESLLIQLDRAGEAASIEYKIVRDHLEDLARKRYPQIARALGTNVERITEAASRIGRLTPNPGGDFDPTGNPYILPDVVIERDDDGEWSARLTNEYLPNLRINDFYKDMIGRSKTDGKTRQFLRDQIRDGRSLIRSISLRQETILAIAYKLIEHQPAFLAKGHRHLRPLTMNDIADQLSLHATTVSRAVAGKYILTPHGLMEMRAFFATGYQTEGGEEVSNAGVREAIQQIIAQENPSKPLSDDALAKQLKAQGINVARRTVAKYREQLNILPSHLRKSF
ncbi:RNA polymerase factor sigma-54 [Luteolibacter sp. LG18]|uniref:RNA polymerase factor sigma-54 n=1 Tax=Luteolibacter sp. LG18 TaxID=2819286 RepID=UPI002B2C35BB|nr:RNA polymerase sigma-54 factor [Luteolibacter sp. LG18]